MIAMNVRDEDMAELGKGQAGMPHLQLSPLSTVNHEQLPPAFHYLRCREMMHGGQCTATSKDM